MQKQKEIKPKRNLWTSEAQEGALFALSHKQDKEAKDQLKALGCFCQAPITRNMKQEVACSECNAKVRQNLKGI